MDNRHQMTLADIQQASTRLGNADLSRVQFDVLHALSVDDMKMTDIAKLCRHTTASATGMIDRMTKAGWVSRKHGDYDRRIIFVKITDQGKTKLKSLADA